MDVRLAVAVHGTNGSAIRRDVAVSCVSDLLVAVAAATEQLQAQRPGQTCAFVVVQPVPARRQSDTARSGHEPLLPGDIEIINICGRVTHVHTPAGVVRPVCQPLMIRSRDSFGLRTGIFTAFGNFMTSESNQTTLFRGAKRSSDVLMIAEHIFEPASIERIAMHMLVAKAQLPHAVLADACQFEDALLDSTRWTLSTVTVSEDMTYMKPLHLRLHDGRNTCVLVHIYSSGIVFFFVTCPDTPLSVDEEARVAAQCGDVYACLAAVA